MTTYLDLMRARVERAVLASGRATVRLHRTAPVPDAEPWRQLYARDVAALLAVAEAAEALWEQVEMDESVGVCLSVRGPSMALGQALAYLRRPAE